MYRNNEETKVRHMDRFKLGKHNDFCVRIYYSVFHSLDDSILHIDVSTEGLVIVHDLPSFDQETVALQKQKKG